MLQISKGARQYANPVYLKKLIEAAVSLSNIPIAVHLDHGDSFELCKDCIDEGFTSVMIDASHEPFEKNVEICQQGRRVRPQAQLRRRRRAGPPRRRAVRRRRRRRQLLQGGALHQSRAGGRIREAVRRGFAGGRHRQLARRLQVQGRTAPRPRTPQSHQEGAHGRRPRAITRWCCTALPACPRTWSRKSTSTAASWAPTPPACRKRTSKSPAASAAPRSTLTPTCAWP